MSAARESFFRRSIADLVPYEPGKPVEEVQRELGVDRVVKLASNEGAFGPFPAALEAMERAASELNRYPDGGAWALRSALADRHDVRFEEVAVGSGADGVIDCLSQAVLDEGDEVVLGWPSFPSYVLDAIKCGGVPVRVPLREHRYDLDALLGSITPRTKLVYVCHPNNPTGTANTRDELDRFFAHMPEHVLTVLDQAYFECVDDPDYVDGLELFRRGLRVVVLRTFSKIYGLAGLRIGYGIAPADVVTEMGKVRRAFDVSTLAQIAALASIHDTAEIERRRRATEAGRAQLAEIMRAHGLEPVLPAFGNFLFAETGQDDARPLFEQLLRAGVIVRPLAGFGAPGAIRVTVGTSEENEVFGAALAQVLAQTLA
ncbi:MAG TPA: histidinol-phosphate transaminase [Candidatus Binatia bacterium]|nr:histidinol-phosphate transaminase [Candidatus Binatia bacterium]